jgi:hypothetical protein
VNATCFDCCFHPDVISYAKSDARFQDLVIKTALDGVELSYQRMKMNVKMDRDEVRILKGVKYKSGKVLSLLINKTESQSIWNSNKLASQKSPSPNFHQNGNLSSESTIDEKSSFRSPAEAKPSSIKEEYCAFKRGFLTVSTKRTVPSTAESQSMTPITERTSKPKNESITCPTPNSVSSLASTVILPSSPSLQAISMLSQPVLSSSPAAEPSETIRRVTRSQTARVASMTAPSQSPILETSINSSSLSSPAKDSTKIQEITDEFNQQATTIVNDQIDSLLLSDEQIESQPQPCEYSLVERGILSLGDFANFPSTQRMGEPNSNSTDNSQSSNSFVTIQSSRPAELVYRFNVPLAKKSSQVYFF